MPTGVKPNEAPFGDYFVPNYANVWQPDLDAMRAVGINVIRLYAGNPEGGKDSGKKHTDRSRVFRGIEARPARPRAQHSGLNFQKKPKKSPKLKSKR